jgi:hypothetical protein
LGIFFCWNFVKYPRCAGPVGRNIEINKRKGREVNKVIRRKEGSKTGLICEDKEAKAGTRTLNRRRGGEEGHRRCRVENRGRNRPFL